MDVLRSYFWSLYVGALCRIRNEKVLICVMKCLCVHSYFYSKHSIELKKNNLSLQSIISSLSPYVQTWCISYHRSFIIFSSRGDYSFVFYSISPGSVYGHAPGGGLTRGPACAVGGPRTRGHWPCFSSSFNDHGTSGRRQTDFLLPLRDSTNSGPRGPVHTSSRHCAVLSSVGFPVESQTARQTERMQG